MDGDIAGVLAQEDWLALLYVTVSGTSPCWFDPDGDKLARLLSCVGSQSQCFLESFLVGNDVIGWKNKHCGGVIASNNPASTKGDRGGCVAFGRFSNDVLFWKTTKQFAHRAFLVGVCQDQRVVRWNNAFKASQGFFEQ